MTVNDQKSVSEGSETTGSEQEEAQGQQQKQEPETASNDESENVNIAPKETNSEYGASDTKLDSDTESTASSGTATDSAVYNAEYAFDKLHTMLSGEETTSEQIPPQDEPKRIIRPSKSEQQQQSTTSTSSWAGKFRGVGSSLNKMPREKPISWEDAMRADDAAGGNPYQNFLDLSDLEDGDAIDVEDILQNIYSKKASSGSGATEEERKARRERIRARQEEKEKLAEALGNIDSNDSSSEGHRFYYSADGSIKKVPGFAREEYLDSMREGGVPVKSWIAIVAVVGFGTYKIVKLMKGPEANGRIKKQTSFSSAKKRSVGGKGKRVGDSFGAGKKKGRPPMEPSIDPELERMLSSASSKSDSKTQQAKKKVTKKKRAQVKKAAPRQNGISGPVSNNTSDISDDDAKSLDSAKGSDAKATSSSTNGGSVSNPPPLIESPGSDNDMKLHSYNEDDRRAIMEVLNEESNGNSNEEEGEWQMAGRKSKAKKSYDQTEAASIPVLSPANPDLGVDKIAEVTESSSQADMQPTTENATENTTPSENADESTANQENSAANDVDTDSEWQTAGRNAKATAKAKAKKAPSPAPAAISSDEKNTTTDNNSANDKSSENKADTATSDDNSESSHKTQSLPVAKDTFKEDDAALARKMQKQEETMAARENGQSVDEEWEEVPSKRKHSKNKKKAEQIDTSCPSTAIAAS